MCLTSAMYFPAAAEAASGVLPRSRASMYAAYQSHQSCGGATASNAPGWSAVSCRSSARAAMSIGHTRPLFVKPVISVHVRGSCDFGGLMSTVVSLVAEVDSRYQPADNQ